MCTDVAIMERGVLLAAGSPESIRDRMGQGRQLRVRLVGGEVRSYTVASDEEQAQLLRSLLDQGLPVLEFNQVGDGLEDLFMRLVGRSSSEASDEAAA